MSANRTADADKEFWRRLAIDQGRAAAPVSDVDFAAWLEGRLPASEAARVDAAVASDPEMRRAALELADILGKPLPAAPERLAVRGKALVGFEAERRIRGGGSWIGRMFGTPAFLQQGAMAGMAVMLAAVGFVMGGGLGESYSYEKYASRSGSTNVSRPLGSDTTGDLTDLFLDAT